MITPEEHRFIHSYYTHLVDVLGTDDVCDTDFESVRNEELKCTCVKMWTKILNLKYE